MEFDLDADLYVRVRTAIAARSLIFEHVGKDPGDERAFFYERYWILELGDENCINLLTHSEFADESEEAMRKLLGKEIMKLEVGYIREWEACKNAILASSSRILTVLGMGARGKVVTVWRHNALTMSEASAWLRVGFVIAPYQ